MDVAASEFFGPNNHNIELVKKSFPKLKIVARGNKIKIYGDSVVMDEFEKNN